MPSEVRFETPLRKRPTNGTPLVLATGGFQADPELLRRHVTINAGEVLLRAAPGSTGDAVRAVQVLFPQLAVDGVYGPATESAVRKFQEMFGLVNDGIVGPNTWHALVITKFE